MVSVHCTQDSVHPSVWSYFFYFLEFRFVFSGIPDAVFARFFFVCPKAGSPIRCTAWFFFFFHYKPLLDLPLTGGC